MCGDRTRSRCMGCGLPWCSGGKSSCCPPHTSVPNGRCWTLPGDYGLRGTKPKILWCVGTSQPLFSACEHLLNPAVCGQCGQRWTTPRVMPVRTVSCPPGVDDSVDAYNVRAMHWMVDGYNVIRRDPALSSQEALSIEAGRDALCRLLARTARESGETFTVVFDGAGSGGAGSGGGGVRVIFSSARESADRVLARLAIRGGAVVSNDREVRRAAERAGAVAITTDQFLT